MLVSYKPCMHLHVLLAGKLEACVRGLLFHTCECNLRLCSVLFVARAVWFVGAPHCVN
jgi:hypothetical protein